MLKAILISFKRSIGLPCLLVAPEDAVILYGQPNEGLVFVNVSDGKDKAAKLMTYFKEMA